MNLEEKLINSNNNIDKLLNEEILVKLVCVINGKVLLDNNKCLPSINLKKGQLDNNIIIIFNELLNITINSISNVPFEKYNNYNERYYAIEIDEEDFLNLNNNYSFDIIDNMSDEIEKQIISK